MREIGVGFSGDGFLENAGEVEAAYGKIKGTYACNIFPATRSMPVTTIRAIGTKHCA